MTAFTVVTRDDQPAAVIRASSTGPVTERCPTAQRAITHYRRAYTAIRARMSLTGAVPRVWYLDCAVVRRRATEWREKTSVARKAYEVWHAYHWDWQSWLPDKWARIGACETGYGRRPGNWSHWNSGYEGAFGFAHSSWDGFVGSADPKAGPYPASAANATPRQQYEVALAIYRRYGLSGWGCRGA